MEKNGFACRLCTNMQLFSVACWHKEDFLCDRNSWLGKHFTTLKCCIAAQNISITLSAYISDYDIKCIIFQISDLA